MIKAFMKWYGQPIDDVKIKVPKTLPPYTETDDVEKVLAAAANKRSHKDRIERDRLLVMLDWKTGMRRGELASLCPKDIHGDWLIIRGGKGKKDRVMPLPASVAGRLQEFIKDKSADKLRFSEEI